MSSKLIKDPIYGYVNIESNLASGIIDTACFQRLRNIRQTSYAPLYPASFHNRFLHSIGVYYLGCKAFESVNQSLGNEKGFGEDEWATYKRIFELACLLHDVGHAPFSHTGERFFETDENMRLKIYKKLSDLVNYDTFSIDVEQYCKNGEFAAPHEIMSCIVSLETFSTYMEGAIERDFFVRCITGFKYRETKENNNDILNCLIELLNSSIIDVDRLDYIIRDAHTTGFQSVSIDYERLLKGVRIISKDGIRYLGYHKGALSVIENVIYAHDAERKWIQNHPTILYEHFLIQHAMRTIDKHFSSDDSAAKIFSYESLTKTGMTFKDKGKISLLADEDILYIMKNICPDSLSDEYFARNERRRPIWKSEAEYRVLFDNALGKDTLDKFEIAFQEVEKYLTNNFSRPIINDKALAYIHEEEKKICENKRSNSISPKDYDNLLSGNAKVKKWVLCLKEISDENNLPFDYAIISAHKFKSGFLKQDLEKMLIDFPGLNKKAYIRDVSTILMSEKTRDSFFYLFYRGRDEDGFNKEGFIDKITKALSVEALK